SYALFQRNRIPLSATLSPYTTLFRSLVRLVEQSWLTIVQIGSLVTAAFDALSEERMRELHARPMQRVEGLVERGRADGAFRTDLDRKSTRLKSSHVKSSYAVFCLKRQ